MEVFVRLIALACSAFALIAALVVAGSLSAPTTEAGGTVYTVTNTDDPGTGTCTISDCSLHDAIDAANGGQGNTIAFNIENCLPNCTIDLASELPAITQPFTLVDGSTQSGYEIDDQPLVFIDGSALGSGNGLTISASDVEVVGLKFTGFPGDGINASAITINNLTLTGVNSSDNDEDGVSVAISGTLIVQDSTLNGNGMAGVYSAYSTATNATFARNIMTGNGSGGIAVAVNGTLMVNNNQIIDNDAEYGIYAAYSTMNSATFDQNELSGNGKDGAAVAVSGTLMVTDNQINGNDDSGIYSAYSTTNTATFTGNTVTGNGHYGVSTAVSDNLTFTDNLVKGNDPGLYAAYTTTTAGNIAMNTFEDNGSTGVAVAGGLTIHHNRIVGNATGLSSSGGGTNAENNWWGCNAGPTDPDCDSVSGPADYDPWLVLTLDVNPNTIPQGGASTLSSSVNTNSDAADTSGQGHIPDDTIETFATTLGSVGSTSAEKTTTNGLASATLTADGGFGTADVLVKLDEQEVPGSVEITEATPTPTPTLAPTPTATATATPTPTPTGTATPTPTATATPAGQTVVWGDDNCSGQADPVDALLTLRDDAGLSTNTGTCPAFGTSVSELVASVLSWGDIDCNGVIDPVDALKLLRFDAALGASQGAGCPPLGSEITIVEN